jgi:hypothetical protein
MYFLALTMYVAHDQLDPKDQEEPLEDQQLRLHAYPMLPMLLTKALTLVFVPEYGTICTISLTSHLHSPLESLNLISILTYRSGYWFPLLYLSSKTDGSLAFELVVRHFDIGPVLRRIAYEPSSIPELFAFTSPHMSGFLAVLR